MSDSAEQVVVDTPSLSVSHTEYFDINIRVSLHQLQMLTDRLRPPAGATTESKFLSDLRGNLQGILDLFEPISLGEQR